CTCPSHKFPCKHGLALLLLALDPKAVPEAEPPEWVASWLDKRATAGEAKHEKAAKAASAAPSKDQERRAAKREALVTTGLDALDLWMGDLIRNGLAAVESQPATFWERAAAQLVDAQAPGFASRVRALAEIPGSRPDWPERLLGQLGRLALLTHAYRRSVDLAPDLREDVRDLAGWHLKEEEVEARGEHVSDDWLALGQYVRDEERGRTQRTWLLGTQSGRPALVLQFSYMNAPFKETFVPGLRQHGEVAFWPGAAGLRAHFVSRSAQTQGVDAIPGAASIEEFLAGVARTLGRQPWQERFLCTLRSAVPIYDPAAKRWLIRDEAGAALPLRDDDLWGDHWRLLAISGGAPVEFAGEWNGEGLLPLGIVAGRAYYQLAGVM
ncbi:MAG TPA: SWIM zinc finger family protein, partial [Ktedonobacterales bacterium]|nr:SWIM zinc finger family protein [Ktedonobacterales bacterium]